MTESIDSIKKKPESNKKYENNQKTDNNQNSHAASRTTSNRNPENRTFTVKHKNNKKPESNKKHGSDTKHRNFNEQHAQPIPARSSETTEAAGTTVASSREYWRPSNLLYPLPAVLISCADENGKANIMTAAWTGTICSDPVMVYVSIRPSRYSHDIIERTGEFVINLTTRQLVRAADYAGVRSGSKEDKITALHLHLSPSRLISAPGIAESPVGLECKVTQILRLGSHDMFLARVVSTDIDPQYLDEKGKLDLNKADLVVYSHGEYHDIGKILGTFGFSVRKAGREK